MNFENGKLFPGKKVGIMNVNKRANVITNFGNNSAKKLQASCAKKCKYLKFFMKNEKKKHLFLLSGQKQQTKSS